MEVNAAAEDNCDVRKLMEICGLPGYDLQDYTTS
jgi:hypothetical protein